MFEEIPTARPATPLLDQVNTPEDLRAFNKEQLPSLVRELREFMLYSVGQTGGHFGAGLGVVELTVALHYIYNTPEDRIVWDVGHQAYPHKILTGRREALLKIRQEDGISGFPKREESPFDNFGVGHSSTSIGAALGMALAARQFNTGRKSVAVIGDGAMSAGMAFEALNHAGHVKADMLVILNDNEMSISKPVGALSSYFARIWASKTYDSIRKGGQKVFSGLPSALELARKAEEHMKGMVSPGMMFEELGFNYIGPIDGHDIEHLLTTIANLKDREGPQFLHVITKKGKGFEPAEGDPIGYHAINKVEPDPVPAKPQNKQPKYCNIFGQWVCDAAEQDARLAAITPAMKEGSDLIEFAERFPDRYFDVAIAEQHAVTLAAGMACDGIKPVVAIYSTFLQRGYDQLIHDVALQNLDVLFAIDRAGLVGEDGPTHAGVYDLSYLRCIPNMVVMAPSDEDECRKMLQTGYIYQGPAAVRYPRGNGPGITIDKTLSSLEIGKSRSLREGHSGIVICSFGRPTYDALQAADALDASLLDMRFVKPLDEQALLENKGAKLIVTVEENAIMGGAGSAVSEFLIANNILVPTLHLGLPDQYEEHASHNAMLKRVGLDSQGILSSIQEKLKSLYG
ncbi:1-deoxy-D-xylulose-5-phosphate synthase [Marinomonas posidonica]|uniref:1-deoxy-D-xylulose-5-phosphate synthase n=1 Tax=Marinomonas posidonica (strain CECT 7376 / NCIMB 14433 / IVIA-Po-181) TaxID=491952 RepID=F6CYQ7_MARPP|nr:1-deoxy-D-xylulose-5-phosphate synthase [Marinomonas posidonica]AEF55739.1 1-deoxy-D-xylulose-5-phosphate synthase [Marinomonas posidonica IVIA-Po-181]